MNIIEEIENEQLEKLAQERPIPKFGPGDTLRVNVKVTEGSRERVQAFEGVCIGRKNAGLNSAFTVRKISYGEGVERVFPLYSTIIDSIEVVRRGDVRRAKLYYLRGLTGKRARITEKTDWTSKKDAAKAAAKSKDKSGDKAEAEVEAKDKAEKPKKAQKDDKKKAKKEAKKKDKVEVPETGEAEAKDVAPPEKKTEEKTEEKAKKKKSGKADKTDAKDDAKDGAKD